MNISGDGYFCIFVNDFLSDSNYGIILKLKSKKIEVRARLALGVSPPSPDLRTKREQIIGE